MSIWNFRLRFSPGAVCPRCVYKASGPGSGCALRCVKEGIRQEREGGLLLAKELHHPPHPCETVSLHTVPDLIPAPLPALVDRVRLS